MSFHGEMYINGAACVSPQPTFEQADFLKEVRSYNTNKIYCVEPDYSKFLDAVAIRRMSRIVKFGTTTGLMALKESGIKNPDAISTATGYGLLEMSQRFLQDCVSSGEGIVSPTTFIQSTHNTVSSNIAIIIGCHAHNNTFSQKGFSFESTLYDACLMMKEGASQILIGAYEEVGAFNYAAMVQAKELKLEPCNNLETFDYTNEGNILGEGAAFFVLEDKPSQNTYGKLIGYHTFLNENDTSISITEINRFLVNQGIDVQQIDVLLLGINGDLKHDSLLNIIAETIFPTSTIAAFKHLCGEYMTASAFAFWLSAQMMKKQEVPEILLVNDKKRAPKCVLVYNAYERYHSVMLFNVC